MDRQCVNRWQALHACRPPLLPAVALGAWRMWAKPVKDISTLHARVGAGIKRAFDGHSAFLASLTKPGEEAGLAER